MGTQQILAKIKKYSASTHDFAVRKMNKASSPIHSIIALSNAIKSSRFIPEKDKRQLLIDTQGLMEEEQRKLTHHRTAKPTAKPKTPLTIKRKP